MDDPRNLAGRANVEHLTVGVILAVILLSGPVGGIDLTAPPSPGVGDGTASIDVLEPNGDTLGMTAGRFGTDVTYVRIPDLVADIERVEGRPRVRYSVSVPGLDVDRQETRTVESTGRLRIPLDDRAFWDPKSRTYEGRLVVEVQSFTETKTVLNRSIEVVPR